MTDSRYQQLLLIRIAIEDFYHEKYFYEDDKYYAGLKEDLVNKVDGENLRFACSNRNDLTRLIYLYIKKERDSNNLDALQANYPSLSKYFGESGESDKKVKLGLSGNTINDVIQLFSKADPPYTKFKNENPPNTKGYKFIFTNFNENITPQQSLNNLKKELGLDAKSLSLKKNKYYEIPTEFMSLIEYHTNHFVQREEVIDRFEKFSASSPNGYFIIQGEPGIGKTAFLAHYAQKYNSPCYFIQKAQGINKIEDFIDSICKQMCFKYYDQLGYLEPQLGNHGDINLFNKMLQVLTKFLPNTQDKKLVIVIDALDEVVQSESTENVLKLPVYVPEGIYFLMSQRPKKVFFTSEAPLLVVNFMALISVEKSWKTSVEKAWKINLSDYFTNYLLRSKSFREKLAIQIKRAQSLRLSRTLCKV